MASSIARAEADCARFEQHLAAANSASADAEAAWRISDEAAAKRAYESAADELAMVRSINSRGACSGTPAMRLSLFLVDARMKWLGLTPLQSDTKALPSVDDDLQKGWKAIAKERDAAPDVFDKAGYYVREVRALAKLQRSITDGTALQTLMCSHDVVPIELVTPDMPRTAAAAGAEGTAQVKVTMDDTGRLLQVSIFRSTNNRALDGATLDAASRSQYAPEVRSCKTRGGSYMFTATFQRQR
jgi:TonB family protein